MMEIQLTGVQHPAGRGHEHVRAFGTRVSDVRDVPLIVEVHLSVAEAAECIEHANTHSAFPIVIVEDNRWMYCATTAGVQMIYLTPNHEEPTG